jgi:Kae1-associated kinase Bud32
MLSSGAEATIYIDGSKISKERVSKSYRHEFIDINLRKTRTRKEVKILKSLEKYGFVPRIIENSEYNILMEHIDGVQVKKLLDKNPKLAGLIGKNLSIMHDLDIIHGDLTTSNMILRDNKLFFIDFGLSFSSARIEDKAVDIHLFKQALGSRHFRVAKKAYAYFFKNYNPKNKKEILERLSIVEQRGRYKEKSI